MAEQSGFFNSNVVNGEYDRVYLAEHFAKYFASFISNGVFGGKSNELMVSQAVDSGMKIEVLSGMAWINGFWYENTSNLSLDISVADGVLNRIDNVVIKYGNVERKIWAEVVKGVPATNAVAPEVKRNSDYYELKLAEIYVKAGATKITQANITDTRLNSDICGFVVGILKQFDTTEFGKQLASYISEYSADYKNYLNNLKLSGEADLTNLIQRLNNLVQDESVLLNLSFKVDDVANQIALANQTLGYGKKNLIPFPYKQLEQTVNGVKFTVNDDGTVTANGTPTNDVAIFELSNVKLDTSKKYLLTDDVNPNLSTYYTQLYSNQVSPITSYSGAFTPEDVIYTVRIIVKTKVSNLVFKPMIRDAKIIDSTWEPYKLSVADMIQEDDIEKGCFYRIDRLTGVKTWINPPNKPGIEYCTTEMWDNKPVYQMTFYVASLPVNSAMSIASNTEWDKVISVNGYAHDADDLTFYPFPIILHSQITPIAVISRVESDGYIVITTNGDASYFRAYITIRYTKR